MSGVFETIGTGVGGVIGAGGQGLVEGLPGAVQGAAAGTVLGAAGGALVGGTAGAIGGLGLGDVLTIPAGALTGAAIGGRLGMAGGAVLGGAPGFAQGMADGFGPGAHKGAEIGKSWDDYISAMVHGNKKAKKKDAAKPAQACSDCGNPDQDPKKDKDGKPLGTKGTQTSSKTLHQADAKPGDSNYVRVDVENPAPGERPGSLHAQFGGEGSPRYNYNPYSGQFEPGAGAPPLSNSQQALLRSPQVQNAVQKGLGYLKP